MKLKFTSTKLVPLTTLVAFLQLSLGLLVGGRWILDPDDKNSIEDIKDETWMFQSAEFNKGKISSKTYERVVLEGSKIRISCPHFMATFSDISNSELESVANKQKQFSDVEQEHQQTARMNLEQVKWFRNHVPLLNLNHFQLSKENHRPDLDEEVARATINITELNQTAELYQTSESNIAADSLTRQNANEHVDILPSANTQLDLRDGQVYTGEPEWYMNKFGELVINNVSQHFAGKYSCLVAGRQSEVLLDVLLDNRGSNKLEQAFKLVSTQQKGAAQFHETKTQLTRNLYPKDGQSNSSRIADAIGRGANKSLESSTVNNNRVKSIKNDAEQEKRSSRTNFIKHHPIHLVKSEVIQVKDLKLVPGFIYSKQQLNCPMRGQFNLHKDHIYPFVQELCFSHLKARIMANRVKEELKCYHLVKRLLARIIEAESGSFTCVTSILDLTWFKDGEQLEFDTNGRGIDTNQNVKLINFSDQVEGTSAISNSSSSDQEDFLEGARSPQSNRSTKWICPERGRVLEIDGVRKDSAGHYTCALKLSIPRLHKIIQRVKRLNGSLWPEKWNDNDNLCCDELRFSTDPNRQLNEQSSLAPLDPKRRAANPIETSTTTIETIPTESAASSWMEKQSEEEKKRIIIANGDSLTQRIALLESILNGTVDREQSMDYIERLLLKLQNPLASVQTFSLLVVERSANTCDLWSTIKEASNAYTRRKLADFKRLKRGLSKNRASITSNLKDVYSPIDKSTSLSTQSEAMGTSSYRPSALYSRSDPRWTSIKRSASIIDDATKLLVNKSIESEEYQMNADGKSQGNQHINRIGDSSTPDNELMLEQTSNESHLMTGEIDSGARLSNIDNQQGDHLQLNNADDELESDIRVLLDGQTKSYIKQTPFNYANEVNLKPHSAQHTANDAIVKVLNRSKRASLTERDHDQPYSETNELITRGGSEPQEINKELSWGAKLPQPSQFQNDRHPMVIDDLQSDRLNPISLINGIAERSVDSGAKNHIQSFEGNEGVSDSKDNTKAPIDSDRYEKAAKDTQELRRNGSSNNDETKSEASAGSSNSAYVDTILTYTATGQEESTATDEALDESLMWSAGQYLYMHMKAVAASSMYGVEVGVEWSNERSSSSNIELSHPEQKFKLSEITQADLLDDSIHYDKIYRDAVPFATIDVIAGQNLYLQCTAHALGRLPEVRWYKLVNSIPTRLRSRFRMIRKIGSDLYWPLTELDLLDEADIRKQKSFVSSQTTTIFDNLENQTFTVVNTLQLSQYNDKAGHETIKTNSQPLANSNLYACIVDADIRHNYATLGVHFREAPSKLPLEISKRLHARSVLTSSESTSRRSVVSMSSVTSSPIYSRYDFLHKSRLQIPMKSYWIPIQNNSLYKQSLDANKFPLTPAVLSMIIVIVFSSLLALIYLTMRSYRALTQFHYEEGDILIETIKQNYTQEGAEITDDAVQDSKQGQVVLSGSCEHDSRCPCQFEKDLTIDGSTYIALPEVLSIIHDDKSIIGCNKQSDILTIEKSNGQMYYEAHCHNIDSPYNCHSNPTLDCGPEIPSTKKFGNSIYSEYALEPQLASSCCQSSSLDLASKSKSDHLRINMFRNPMASIE